MRKKRKKVRKKKQKKKHCYRERRVELVSRVPGPARHFPRRLEPAQHVDFAGPVGDGPDRLNEPARLERLEHPRDRGLLQVGARAELFGPDADVSGRLDGLVDEDFFGREPLEARAVPRGRGLEELAAVGRSVGSEGVLILEFFYFLNFFVVKMREGVRATKQREKNIRTKRKKNYTTKRLTAARSSLMAPTRSAWESLSAESMSAVVTPCFFYEFFWSRLKKGKKKGERRRRSGPPSFFSDGEKETKKLALFFSSLPVACSRRTRELSWLLVTCCPSCLPRERRWRCRRHRKKGRQQQQQLRPSKTKKCV